MMENATLVKLRRAGVDTVLALRCLMGVKGKLFGQRGHLQVAANDIGTLFLGFDEADGVWEPTYGDVVWIEPDDRPQRGPFRLEHVLEEGFGTPLGHFVIDLADFPGA